MDILPPKPTSQRIIDAIQDGSGRIAGHLEQIARLLNHGHAALWSGGTDDEIAQALNAIGPERLGLLFSVHNALGLAVNAALEASGPDAPTVRAITTPGREIAIGPDGTISVVPLPVPEPQPDPPAPEEPAPTE